MVGFISGPKNLLSHPNGSQNSQNFIPASKAVQSRQLVTTPQQITPTIAKSHQEVVKDIREDIILDDQQVCRKNIIDDGDPEAGLIVAFLKVSIKFVIKN